eukprot:TsM_000340400 transcript=TsM_000340400 gene=TsM_000340400
MGRPRGEERRERWVVQPRLSLPAAAAAAATDPAAAPPFFLPFAAVRKGKGGLLVVSTVCRLMERSAPRMVGKQYSAYASSSCRLWVVQRAAQARKVLCCAVLCCAVG